jgi:hypothetical protein
MIRLMGKKGKRDSEPATASREITAEADYFARKCGLTREEAQQIIDEARVQPSVKTLLGDVKAV